MMRFIFSLRRHKILFGAIVFGWIIFAIGFIAGINPWIWEGGMILAMYSNKVSDDK